VAADHEPRLLGGDDSDSQPHDNVSVSSSSSYGTLSY
jgi:hypothetical protein